MKLDKAAAANQALWEREVQQGCGYTVPWLDLDRDTVRQYAGGALPPAAAPETLALLTPRALLADAAGRDVLCLACGGGQQTAVFGLLGARVTVVDLAAGQLAGDRAAAAHYGYPLTALHGDMRDLSPLPDAAFDLVYGTAVTYVPDVQQVYREVARVLRPGGLYRCDWTQPALHFTAWDGAAYRITRPYAEQVDQRTDGGIEFRHYLDDIFNGLLAAGLAIRQVDDLSRHTPPDPRAAPGSWAHESTYLGGHFVIVAQKRMRRR